MVLFALHFRFDVTMNNYIEKMKWNLYIYQSQVIQICRNGCMTWGWLCDICDLTKRSWEANYVYALDIMVVQRRLWMQHLVYGEIPTSSCMHISYDDTAMHSKGRCLPPHLPVITIMPILCIDLFLSFILQLADRFNSILHHFHPLHATMVVIHYFNFL